MIFTSQTDLDCPNCKGKLKESAIYVCNGYICENCSKYFILQDIEPLCNKLTKMIDGIKEMNRIEKER